MQCVCRRPSRIIVLVALSLLTIGAGLNFSPAADKTPLPKLGMASQPSPSVPASRPADPGAGNNSAQQPDRLREGARLTDATGSFGFVGDRIAFHPDGSSDSFRVLENLALERISRVLSEGQGPSLWTVSGTVMEYRGANFLLVQKAVIRSDEGRRP